TNEDVEITVSDATTYTMTLNDEEYNGDIITVDGDYVLVVTDAANNSTTINFTIDQTNPKLLMYEESSIYPYIQLVESGIVTNSNIQLSITDKTEVTIEVTKDELSYGEYTKGPITFTEDGEYVVTVTDAANNTSEVTFTIDTINPVVTGITDGDYTNEDVEITVSDATDYTLTLNDEEYNGDIITADGDYVLVVTDAADNSTTINFTIDQTTPSIELENGLILESIYNKHINLVITDTNLVKVEYTLNGGEVKTRNPLTSTSSKYQFGDATTGEGKYVVTVTDAANNTSEVTFTIDKTAPVVTGITDGDYTNEDVEIAVSDITTYTMTLNDEEYNGDVITADGEYVLVVTDAADNSTTINFTIDQTTPSIELENGLILESIYNKHINLVITDTNLVKVEYTLNGGEVKTRNPLTSTSSKYQFGDATTGEGKYVVTVTDAANNTSEVTFTIDKTAPVVTGITDGDYTNEDVEITVSDATDYTMTLNDKEYNGDVITVDGDYVLVVTDAANNTSEVTFTIDKTVPIINVTNVNENNIGLNPAIEIIELNDFKIIVTDVNGDVKREKENQAYFSLGYLEDGDYKVTVTDAANNTSEVTVTVGNPIVTVVDTNVENDATIASVVNFELTDGTVNTITLNGVSVDASKTTFDEAGSYVINYTDANGEEISYTFEIETVADLTNNYDITDGAVVSGFEAIDFEFASDSETSYFVKVTSGSNVYDSDTFAGDIFAQFGDFEITITDENGVKSYLNFTKSFSI
ncbi:MAG: hypothetical protein R3Y21_05205, partial [Mycoplasmatota bacterium]